MSSLEGIIVDDSRCFACGPENPVGLKLKFSIEPGSGRAVCKTTLADHFSGWKGAAHGGIITTLLDETMVYACSSTGVFTVTGTITVKFHRPVPVSREITITGEVDEKRERHIKTSGKISYQGKILANAHAVLIPVKKADDAMDQIRNRLIP